MAGARPGGAPAPHLRTLPRVALLSPEVLSMRAISKRLRLSPKTRPLRAVACLACALLLALLLWSHGGGTGDGARPCRWGCASLLLAETNARLLRQFAGQPPVLLKLHAAPVLDATHPHVLVLCESCDCDVCGHYQNTASHWGVGSLRLADASHRVLLHPLRWQYLTTYSQARCATARGQWWTWART